MNFCPYCKSHKIYSSMDDLRFDLTCADCGKMFNEERKIGCPFCFDFVGEPLDLRIHLDNNHSQSESNTMLVRLLEKEELEK